TMFPFITPATLSLSLSNSVSNPKGSSRQNNLMKKELIVAYCLGYGKSLMHSHLPCCKRKSLIDLRFRPPSISPIRSRVSPRPARGHPLEGRLQEAKTFL